MSVDSSFALETDSNSSKTVWLGFHLRGFDKLKLKGKNDYWKQTFKQTIPPFSVQSVVSIFKFWFDQIRTGKLGEVTKAENIKADLQRRIKPTAGGAEKKIKKDWKN
jgi:hypothetical protein